MSEEDNPACLRQNGGYSRACHRTADHALRLARAEYRRIAPQYVTARTGAWGLCYALPGAVPMADVPHRGRSGSSRHRWRCIEIRPRRCLGGRGRNCQWCGKPLITRAEPPFGRQSWFAERPCSWFRIGGMPLWAAGFAVGRMMALCQLAGPGVGQVGAPGRYRHECRVHTHLEVIRT